MLSHCQAVSLRENGLMYLYFFLSNKVPLLLTLGQMVKLGNVLITVCHNDSELSITTEHNSNIVPVFLEWKNRFGKGVVIVFKTR